MTELGHQVEMFDPTISRPPKKVKGANFYRIGVEGNFEDNSSLDLRSLKSLREFCKPVKGNLVLKVDVEGAEWKAFANSAAAELQHYELVLVEFHGLSDLKVSDKFHTMKQAIQNICDTHIPIHLHANNYSRLTRFRNYWFPDAIEVSFYNKKNALRSGLTHSIFPPMILPTVLSYLTLMLRVFCQHGIKNIQARFKNFDPSLEHLGFGDYVRPYSY